MALAWQPLDLVDDPDRWDRGDPADYYDLPELGELLQRPSWHQRAACRGQGTALWFPARGTSAKAAQAICSTCPVQAECRSSALADPHTEGIWAGTTRSTRSAMRKTAA